MSYRPEAIASYYRVAPAIVATIESMPERRAIFADIYRTGIAPALCAIHDGRHEDAYRIYRKLVLDLMSFCACGSALRSVTPAAASPPIPSRADNPLPRAAA